LQPRIAGIFDSDNDAASAVAQSANGLYGADASAQYGKNATDNARLYAAPEVRYANSGDYNSPPPWGGVAAEPPRGSSTVVNPKIAPPRLATPDTPLQAAIGELTPVAPPAQPVVPAVAAPAAPPTEPDDILLVPAKVAKAQVKTTLVPPASGEIAVEKGDTVYSIAQKYDVALRDLLDANTLSAPYTIGPGQKLKLPNARYHTVAAGETLYSVSRAYSVDLNSLVRENRLAEPYGLYAGQKLRLPAAMAASGDQMAAAPVAAPPAVPAVTVPASPVVTAPATTQQMYGSSAAAGKPPAVAAAKPAIAAPSITEKPKTGTAAGDVKKLPAAAARASTKFSWPVTGKIISDFGAKSNGLYNDGINIGAAAGTPVKAAENGVVAYAGNELKGMGNLVIIQHSGGWMTVYAHMESLSVRRGARVAVGEKIGAVGQTGKVTEPQLHFEIRNGTKAYNPTTQLKK